MFSWYYNLGLKAKLQVSFAAVIILVAQKPLSLDRGGSALLFDCS